LETLVAMAAIHLVFFTIGIGSAASSIFFHRHATALAIFVGFHVLAFLNH